MKKANTLQILLELIVILGNLIIGMTILSCQVLGYEVNKTLIGLFCLAIGVIGATEFVSLKYLMKIKSVQSLIAAIVSIALGFIFIFANIELKVVAIIWGSYAITSVIAMMFTSVLNLLKQPLLSGVRVIISVVGTVFAINLIIGNVAFLPNYLTYTGVVLLVQFGILLVEFIIHRYQN